jgi:hypothetical protein
MRPVEKKMETCRNFDRREMHHACVEALSRVCEALGSVLKHEVIGCELVCSVCLNDKLIC